MAYDAKLTLAFGAAVAVVVAAYFLLREGSSIADGALPNMKLTPKQIADYASSAGFSGDDLVVSVAVALAESSGKTGVVGDLALTPGGSVGLWQINLKAHPEYADVDLTDPATNASAAFAIYTAAGNSFRPWSTYKSGAYGDYINVASDAVAV